MLTVLFWNMGGHDRAQVCARLAHRHAVTVLLLAECPFPGVVLGALNPAGTPSRYHLLANPADTRVQMFTRLPPTDWQEVRAERYYSIHRLDRGGSPELLLCATHLPSQLIPSDREQDNLLRSVGQAITEAEVQRRHSRTLVMGDLNADPFHYGVYSTAGLHAVPTRHLALQASRIVAGTTHRFFFNPMWRFFGDATPGPPGTYFWRQSRPDVRFWYMFDQVLFRPELLQYFADRDLEILTGDGQASFENVRDGRPNRAVGSDHFPILIRLNYPGV